MTRILLADESPHAQRMGEQILREEGFEVVTVADGDTALTLLGDFDPDVVLADIGLPKRSGYDLCRAVKNNPHARHTRVVLTAGLLKQVDEEEARRVLSDGLLRKPFEASDVISLVKPLAASASKARSSSSGQAPAELDPDRVRAAVTVALDQAMPKLIDEITARVLDALKP
jgi:CheY-like chemotaxis protein